VRENRPHGRGRNTPRHDGGGLVIHEPGERPRAVPAIRLLRQAPNVRGAAGSEENEKSERGSDRPEEARTPRAASAS
jgi:hypothetical protein